MYRPVMAAAEEDQIPKLRLAPVGPVDDVVGIGIPAVAARKAASPVPVVQGSPDGRRHCSALPSHIQDSSPGIVDHFDQIGIARDTCGGIGRKAGRGMGQENPG